MKITFEPIDTEPRWAPDLVRAKVPGGWLVSAKHNQHGITFIPDPDHKWLFVEKPPKEATKVIRKKRTGRKAT